MRMKHAWIAFVSMISAFGSATTASSQDITKEQLRMLLPSEAHGLADLPFKFRMFDGNPAFVIASHISDIKDFPKLDCPIYAMCISNQDGEIRGDIVIHIPDKDFPSVKGAGAKDCGINALCITETDIASTTKDSGDGADGGTNNGNGGTGTTNDPDDDATSDAKNVECVEVGESCAAEGKVPLSACHARVYRCLK